jgi:hypothetical protein
MAKNEKGPLLFEGRISGDVIEGKVKDVGRGISRTARATRDASTMVSIAE